MFRGNYPGYYNKRPSISDPRIAALPEGIFIGKTVLDIGCNEGRVTCEIGQRLGARRVIGVDIDNGLIQDAWRHRQTVWSMQMSPEVGPGVGADGAQHEPLPDKSEGEPGSPEISLQHARYFPSALCYTFGPIAVPTGMSQLTFPRNVTFRAANWVNDGILEDGAGYDLILALSVSKWIHLSEGDEGIHRFFKRVRDCLKSDGIFVLESQAWEGYIKAKRMFPELKDNFSNLKLRPSDFASIVESLGFVETGHSEGDAVGDGGFRRSILMFSLRPDNRQ